MSKDRDKRDERYGGPSRSLNHQAGNEMPNEGPDSSVDGLDENELALRRLMHGAVRDLRPSDDALDHLHKAVPARRARRRQVVVGAAAAALLVGTAIPAFLHVAGAGGGVKDNPVAVGHGPRTHNGTGAADGAGNGKQGTNSPSGGGGATGKDGVKDKPSGTGKGNQGGAAGGGSGASDKAVKGLPMCSAQQLGVTSASTDPATADGTVYGTFRVSNVSGSQCAIRDAGTMNFQALGAADPARITVVDHTAGDAAGGLPDPSQETTGLVLEPAKAYEVKFAWVPSDTCPTTDPSPDPTPSGGSEGASGTGDGGTPPDAAHTDPQMQYADGDTSDGSVAVVHEAEPGVPAAEATIPNACAGTIYRTGVLDTS
ncbi:hypothetical protein [Streptomyces sp. NBC_00344]|uniref:hypothetical protein n=1 Tax=Streptomyces sp. NBC_00344 TaxID=2975720 RepID=UPI002E24B5BB